MGSGNKKKDQGMSYWDQQAQQNAARINDVDPAEQAIRDQNKRFLDWENKVGHNIGDAPGLQDTIQIGRSAMARADRDRMGTGALQLGDNGTTPYLANLKELKKSEAAENYGSGLEEALQAKRAEVHGSVLPYAQLMTNRRVAAAGNASQMFNNWGSVPDRKPWWQTLVQDAAQAAGAFA